MSWSTIITGTSNDPIWEPWTHQIKHLITNPRLPKMSPNEIILPWSWLPWPQIEESNPEPGSLSAPWRSREQDIDAANNTTQIKNKQATGNSRGRRKAEANRVYPSRARGGRRRKEEMAAPSQPAGSGFFLWSKAGSPRWRFRPASRFSIRYGLGLSPLCAHDPFQ
jgi:hypothetical protein